MIFFYLLCVYDFFSLVKCLVIIFDVGMNNQDLLNDFLYIVSFKKVYSDSVY